MKTALMIFAVAITMISCDETTSSSATCGDGILDHNEECEVGNLGGASCQTEGYYGGTIQCTDTCHLDTTLCTTEGMCGDDVIQQEHGEECEEGQLGDETCLNLGYYGGEITCGDDCRYDLTGCANHGRCGDGTLQANYGEECDGADMGGATCESMGYAAGTLACTEECTFAYSECGGKQWAALGHSSGNMCAIDMAARVYCWGANESGNLGVGNALQQLTPAGVTGPAGEFSADVGSGTNAMCTLDATGALWCAGGSNFIGVGSTPLHTTEATPVEALMPSGRFFTQISVADVFTCAIDNVNDAWCFGLNESGQLGNGTTNPGYQPSAVTMPSGVTFLAISAAQSTNDTGTVCALDATGAAWCWGHNNNGQAGNGTTASFSLPAAVIMPADTTFTQIATGYNHTCALDTAGNAWCWGSNFSGQLGNGTTTNSAIPSSVSMPTGATFVSISSGFNHTCALDTTGTAWCWGGGSYGELGSSTSLSNLPIEVSMPTGITFSALRVLAGGRSTFALDQQNYLWGWGVNTAGELGNGTTDSVDHPVPASTPTM